MKIYVVDAVAFFYYLLDRLPPKADEAFKEAENGKAVLYLPTIVAAELYYLFKKKNWTNYWNILRDKMARIITFRYYPFNEEILGLFDRTKAKEIHDKIIVLTAKVLKAHALITKDKEIVELKEVNTIWD